MIHSDDIYWLLLTYESKLKTRQINEIISVCVDKLGISLEEFYQFSRDDLQDKFELTEDDIEKILQSKELATGQSFILESLEEQNVMFIKSSDSRYPIQLKQSLPGKYPPILFCLGDLSMLEKKIVAIIGQRDAHTASLEFVHKSAGYLASQQIAVVSGFAKGVDQQAYQGTIEGGGQTIVVLAEGMLSAKSAFRKISSSIEEGQVLVVSQFHPNTHWQVGLAMARNQVVVGLADVTMVGQTKADGGTWHGATSALKINKPVFVFMNPEIDLTGANQLIQEGAIPIEPSNQSYDERLAPVLKSCYEERKPVLVDETQKSKETDSEDNQLNLLELPEIPKKPEKPSRKSKKSKKD